MLDRIVSLNVAAVCLGVSVKVLKARLKKAGWPPVAGEVVFGNAVEACRGMEPDESDEHKRMSRMRFER